MLTVLFLCTGNSCRSILAESLLQHWGQGRFRSLSAGSFPTGQVNPMSLRTLAGHGLPTAGFYSKSWDEWRGRTIDIVITVCDQAAGESCPVYPGTPVKAHWGVPDPAHATGTAAEIAAEFDKVFVTLQERVQRLVALPVETMSPEALSSRLTAIGRDEP
ncbi:MAG: arsenate reductase ArsC [Magnetococcales bacterium]|nr:arsenate reductase ArsC [Magnetococcales bacterium]